jgi:hypothetical protein
MRSLLVLLAACAANPPPAAPVSADARCYAGDGTATIRRPGEPPGKQQSYRVVVARQPAPGGFADTRSYADETQPAHVDVLWRVRADELSIGGERLRGAVSGDATRWSFAGRDVRIDEQVAGDALTVAYVERDPTGEPRVERHEHLAAIDCRAYARERATIAAR